MSKLSILSVAVVAACLTQGCASKKSSPATTTAPAATGIVDHPRKLTFPPFTFQPPKAAPYRVPLQSGPVAYVASDRELPLVTISISIRTGDWVEPEGKEGLTDLCGGLLTAAGTETRTAQELEERLAFLA